MSDITPESSTPAGAGARGGPGQVDTPSAQPVQRPGGAAGRSYASLSTDMGTTHISEAVVAKIAGMATREIPGVHSMGRGLARRLGRIRAIVPGQEDITQGVGVEVGEREAAIDLDIVTCYGQSIIEISEAVRRNVIDRVESMTGLKVVEVNINVDDIYIEELDERPAPEPRVR
ncbi:MAG TPA: Asp23/Gls24 family envelope stress response protein [Actinomadura sp.]|nr:Asp23/Gls24 family envelope stress response protein [Actinomadura sp.]